MSSASSSSRLACRARRMSCGSAPRSGRAPTLSRRCVVVFFLFLAFLLFFLFHSGCFCLLVAAARTRGGSRAYLAAVCSCLATPNRRPVQSLDRNITGYVFLAPIGFDATLQVPLPPIVFFRKAFCLHAFEDYSKQHPRSKRLGWVFLGGGPSVGFLTSRSSAMPLRAPRHLAAVVGTDLSFCLSAGRSANILRVCMHVGLYARATARVYMSMSPCYEGR